MHLRDADQLGARCERATRSRLAARSSAPRSVSAELTACAGSSRRLRRRSPASAYRSVPELEGFLEHLVGEVYDQRLRAVVEAVFGGEPVATELRRAPCTRGGHHAYLGGLLEHTVAVGTLVSELCQLHPRLNSDLLMAAALLHDVGKTREFAYGAEFAISEEGAMLGHLAIGAEIIGGPARRLLADEQRLALLHCVLSHHGPEAAGG